MHNFSSVYNEQYAKVSCRLFHEQVLAIQSTKTCYTASAQWKLMCPGGLLPEGDSCVPELHCVNLCSPHVFRVKTLKHTSLKLA